MRRRKKKVTPLKKRKIKTSRNSKRTSTKVTKQSPRRKSKKRNRQKRKPFEPGVSVITCTHHPVFMDNIFRNYHCQEWKAKELILILNRDDLDLDAYIARAAAYPNVRVFQLPQDTSLGVCLNFAVSQAQYNYIAKFDHDDYYGPCYLQEIMPVFRTKKAHVVGKRSYYTFIEGENLLIKRFPHQEHRYTHFVHGATFVIKKSILKRIPFADVPIDDDGIFLRSCRAKRLRVFSTSSSHYMYLRRHNQEDHGWKVETDYLLQRAKRMGHFYTLEEVIHFITLGRMGLTDVQSLERELHLLQPISEAEPQPIGTEVPAHPE